jgi:hypothetical protein
LIILSYTGNLQWSAVNRMAHPELTRYPLTL